MKLYLIILIVVVVVLLTVAVAGWAFYMVAKTYFNNQRKMLELKMKADDRGEALKIITPLRLQAYERMALFLERMAPDSLLLRCYKPGMSITQLRAAATQSVRDEWDHNLSQQIYISADAWNRIREAKEEMINLVNSSAATLADDADPATLAAAIFAAHTKSSSCDNALAFLKAEIS